MRLAALNQPINTEADRKNGEACAGDRSWCAAYMTLAIMIAVGCVALATPGEPTNDTARLTKVHVVMW
jgi:hypothetical protein